MLNNLYIIRVTEGMYCGLRGIEECDVVEGLNENLVNAYAAEWGWELIEQYCYDNYYNEEDELMIDPEFYTEVYKIEEEFTNKDFLSEELYKLGFDLFVEKYCEKGECF